MRMARMQIYLPDELHRAVQELGLKISELAQDAVRREVRRREIDAETDAYLAEIDAEYGPPTDAEVDAARRWLDRALAEAQAIADANRARRTPADA